MEIHNKCVFLCKEYAHPTSAYAGTLLFCGSQYDSDAISHQRKEKISQGGNGLSNLSISLQTNVVYF